MTLKDHEDRALGALQASEYLARRLRPIVDRMAKCRCSCCDHYCEQLEAIFTEVLSKIPTVPSTK